MMNCLVDRWHCLEANDRNRSQVVRSSSGGWLLPIFHGNKMFHGKSMNRLFMNRRRNLARIYSEENKEKKTPRDSHLTRYLSSYRFFEPISMKAKQSK